MSKLFLMLLSSTVNQAVPAAAAASLPLHIDLDKVGPVFDGIGGLSGGGATTRLLVDYPKQQRDEILDFLFKPKFGASLQILKVEIGGDSQSTDGTETSHMHSANDLDYNRGYEWWLLSEAKKRNPGIKTYGLPWAYPGWVGGPEQSGSPFKHPELTSEYILKWLEGARDVYNVSIDYIGIWNERSSDAKYAETLRATLDKKGFAHTRLVAKDGGTDICNDLSEDESYSKAIDIIGLHYPSDYQNFSVCDSLKKPIWASEESSSYDDLNGAACWGRVITSHYALNHMTASIMWNLVGSYYHGTNWYASSMLTAVQPWSGYYEADMPVVWATAHVTQFTTPGMKYLEIGEGSGELTEGGFYTSFVSEDTKDFTLVLVKISRDHAPCTRPGLPDFNVTAETVHFNFKQKSAPSLLYMWESNFEQADNPVIFQKREPITVKNGIFSVNVPVGAMITLSTINDAQKGHTNNPMPKSVPAFPLPFHDTFEEYKESSEAKYFADQIGAFEIHPSVATNSSILKQMVPELPIGWSDHGSNGPMTLIGMLEWQDITVSVDFMIPKQAKPELSACVATRIDQMWRQGIALCVRSETWILSIGGPKLGGVYEEGNIIANVTGPILARNTFHRLSLTTVGGKASAKLNGKYIFSEIAVRDIDTGFAGIGMSDWASVEFDNISLEKAGSNWENPSDSESLNEFQAGSKLGLSNCATNGIAYANQTFELRTDWLFQHVPSGLCAEAGRPNLTLQKCDPQNVRQQLRNDYTRIRNGGFPVTLGAYGAFDSKDELSLIGIEGTSALSMSKKPFPPNAFSAWTYYPNTKQLRNQYGTVSKLGYPMCVTVGLHLEFYENNTAVVQEH